MKSCKKKKKQEIVTNARNENSFLPLKHRGENLRHNSILKFAFSLIN